ncbi:ubiquitin-related domain-containing protein, partial [Rhizophagus irregularis DAOM 181602=DAOM 197198]
MSQLPLVASAISSIINKPVKTYDECKIKGLKVDPSQILDLDTFHKKSFTRIEPKNMVPPKDLTSSDSNKLIQIFVKPLKPLDKDSQSMFVDPSITVLEFKGAICAKFGSDIKMIRLTFNGKQLDDNRTLTSYKIEKYCTIQILSKVFGG